MLDVGLLKYLHTQRELDIDSLRSFIQVQKHFFDYIEDLSDELNADFDEVEEEFMALEMEGAVIVWHSHDERTERTDLHLDDTYIEKLEVN